MSALIPADPLEPPTSCVPMDAEGIGRPGRVAVRAVERVTNGKCFHLAERHLADRGRDSVLSRRVVTEQFLDR